MKKILYVATVDVHIKTFHIPYLKMLKENGYEVHVTTNGDEQFPYCDVKHRICIERNPFKINNLKAIKQLKKIINEEKFDIIHCHTPMGGVVTRLAAREARKSGTRVIYTAHGFHFYKGAPLINWLLFYPIEWYLAKLTDTLITINTEDFERVKKKFKKRCKDIQYVPGVGIDKERFNFEMTQKERNEFRESLGLKDDDFVMIYSAELSKRKNQIGLINATKKLMHENKDIHLLLPGKDSLNGKCQNLAQKMNLKKQIHFLGYRNDIPKLLKISNIAVSASKQEGLPINVLEAIICKLPVVAMKCRGMDDLIENKGNGWITENRKEFNKRILVTKNIKINIKNNSIEKFLIINVKKQIKKIYEGEK